MIYAEIFGDLLDRSIGGDNFFEMLMGGEAYGDVSVIR